MTHALAQAATVHDVHLSQRHLCTSGVAHTARRQITRLATCRGTKLPSACQPSRTRWAVRSLGFLDSKPRLRCGDALGLHTREPTARGPLVENPLGFRGALEGSRDDGHSLARWRSVGAPCKAHTARERGRSSDVGADPAGVGW